MSTAHVPQQPQQQQHTGAAPLPDLPPTPPHASEATRLLCVGTYLDAEYRDHVIEELRLNEQRVVAPSLGLDAARVLVHALRARRRDLLWSGAVVGLWAVAIPLTDGLLYYLAFSGLLLAAAPLLRGRAAEPPWYRVLSAFLARWTGRLGTAATVLVLFAVAFAGGSDSDPGSGHPYGDPYGSGGGGVPAAIAAENAAGAEPWRAWLGLCLLVLIGLCACAPRVQLARALSAELSPQRFPDAAGDPAERIEDARVRRLLARIRLEQHAPLVMYHEARPFCGAGSAHETWVLAVELRPDAEQRQQQPLSNRVILERVRPLIEQLRVPAEYAGPGVRDRLRRLEIDECVFLPLDGLPSRDETPYTGAAFEHHRARAVEEGGEKRRHFLRIRVGGWEEELVVTVFVRLHTQGRMLMLEIAPHVLEPIRADFKDADRTSHRFRSLHLFGKAADAAVLAPGAFGRSLISLVRGAAYAWRLLTGGHANALPDGPARSVRELAAAPAGSTFQDMDVERYLRSIQDRVAHGVRMALADAGYETGEFVRRIVNISNGAVHIGRADHSSFAFGEHGSAETVNSGSEPQKGSH
ncbi:hypothetical protein ABZ354_14690 [Streptomyces sp. NPDC005925]|uniref:hypothetical protein n=1 Tax=Streptomyces sp. NPDC005925 TaxID=3157172 RepID=UPI0033EED83D